MQFLLTAVNSKYIHTNPAIYSLRAFAGEQLWPHIALAEYTINQRPEEILGDLYRRKPNVIGFSCYIWNFNIVRDLLVEIQKILPNTDIWLGGPEVSFEADKLLDQYPAVRGIMVGEGEETFRDLLTCYVEGRVEVANKILTTNKEEELRNIPGLILRQGATPARELLNFDTLPFLYPIHETDTTSVEVMKGLQNRIVYYESSRGCPFRCSYCLSAIDKTVRLRSFKTVEKELQFFLDQQIPQVKFIDRTFNCNHDRAMAIWQYIKENDNSVTNFHFEIAADIMQEDEIELLTSLRPGLVQLEIGVQTTNPETLRLIRRPADSLHIAEVVKKLHSRHNIHIHLDLIAGLPKEDYESFGKSFNEVYAMRPEQLQLGFLKVLKGAPIREEAQEYGIVYQDKSPYEVLYTKWISYGEILRLKQIEEMVELYYNSNQFTHTLTVLEQAFESPFSMFEKLADYFNDKEYFVYSPARSRRYDILLEFAVSVAPSREELFRELLTYDYYLREKAKSRPDFAVNLSSYRDTIWAFYEKEEESPEYLHAYTEFHARQTMKMTHMEVFHYPVWVQSPKEITRRENTPTFMLFDYQQRDPLTGEAHTVYFT